MRRNALRRPERWNFSVSKFLSNLRLTGASHGVPRLDPERTVISTERVQELRDEVGEEDFEEIVSLFIAESDSLVDRLRTIGSRDEAEALLHALKGSALNLGFDELARLCREGRGADAGSGGWRGTFAQLLDVYERSKVRLSEIA